MSHFTVGVSPGNAARKRSKGAASKAKGNAFELWTCRELSAWISKGTHLKLFNRNCISGGSFTRAKNKSHEELGLPGDIAAAHPMAFDLLSLFCIECKHHKNLRIDAFLGDTKGTTFLARVIDKVANEAQAIGVNWMVIAKQNNQEAWLMMDARSGIAAVLASSATYTPFVHRHSLFCDTVMLTTLDHFLKTVDAAMFFARVKKPTLVAPLADNPTKRPRRQLGVPTSRRERRSLTLDDVPMLSMPDAGVPTDVE